MKMDNDKKDVINDSYKKLVEYWNGICGGKYYIEKDYSQNSDYLGLEKTNKNRPKNYFRLEFVPEPFFGNIKEPRIILLALNPSYDSKGDELDEIAFKNANINIPFSKFLQKIDFCDSGNIFNSYLPATTAWWQNRVLKGLNFEKLKGKIGYFNLIGYHSPHNPFNEDRIICESQKLVRDYIIQLINTIPDLKVIVIWGLKNWNLTKETNTIFKIYQINEKNNLNKSIMNAILKEKKNRITNADDLLYLLKNKD